MKRIINYRPICIFALSEVAGLWIASFFLDNTGALLLCLATALVSIGVMLLIKIKKYLYITIAFALGIFLLSGVYGVYNGKKIERFDAEITATVSSEITKHNDYYYFKVENITVDGQKLKKSATVFTYFLPDERAGDEIKISGDINTVEFDVGRYFASSYRNGEYYIIYADSVDGLGEGKQKWTTEIRNNLKRQLYNNVDQVGANIAAALIFGDKTGIDDGLFQDVKDCGLAHIFAVSGLHVGILAGVFFFLAKKLKLRGGYKFAFIMIWPFIYTAICAFPASMVRALIMMAVFLAADVCGKQKDGLNCLAMSAVIVMTLFPVDLFSIGFQMSFAAVLGLIMLNPTLEKPLRFLPKGVREITVSSISVNLMLWPIVSSAFGQVQVLFLIANLIILPILPFMYVITLLICLIVLIIPAASPILIVLNVVLWPIKAASFAVGSLAISSVSAQGIGFAAIAYYLILLIISQLVFISRRAKTQTVLVLTALGICLLII